MESHSRKIHIHLISNKLTTLTLCNKNRLFIDKVKINDELMTILLAFVKNSLLIC